MLNRKLSKLTLVFALMLALLLVACGGQEAEPTQAPIAPTQPADPGAPDPTAVPEEPVVVDPIYGNIDEVGQNLSGVRVVFWHQHTGAREAQLQIIVDEFNATNPYGIIVEARNEGGYNDIYNKMIAGLTTGDVPGLTVAYQNQAAAYMVADGLVSLDPYINHPEYGLNAAELADFFQAFLDGDRLPQFGNQSFGFPPNRSMEMLYYNVEWLAELREAGAISFDGPPVTPEQFTEAVCAAKDNPFSRSADPSFSIGYQVRTDASNFAALVFARGGDIFDYDNNQFTLNTPEAKDAMMHISSLFQDGCAVRIAERFGDQSDFGAGKNLFTMGSSSGFPFYAAAVNEGGTGGFEWSMGAIPHTTPTPVMNIYGASVSVPRTDPATQLAAWLFIRYYTSAEIQKDWSIQSNYFPVRASVVDELEAFYFELNPAYAAAFELLPFTKREAPVAGYDNVRDVMSRAFERVLSGEDIDTVLADAEAEANRLLAEAAP